MFRVCSPSIRSFLTTWRFLTVQQLPMLFLPATPRLSLHSSAPLCWSKKENKQKANLSVVLQKVDDLKVQQRPLPKIGAGDVILAVDCVGVCGSDLHLWKQGKLLSTVVEQPMVLGHEASGVVVCPGKGVKGLKVGDRVAIEPGIPCRVCEYCKTGRYNLCPKIWFCGLPPVDGLLKQYHRHAADFCYKIPDHLTMEEGALIEPLAVAVAACRRAKIKMGMNVLILGSGPIGLLTMLVAKASGANQIMITDVNCDRLDLAKCLGATNTFMTYPEEDTACVVKQIMEKMGGKPHRTMDCCCKVETVKLGMSVTRDGGLCCLVGLHADVVPLALTDAIMREVELVGSFLYPNAFADAISLANRAKLPLKKLITHHFSIKDSMKAFETAYKRTGNTVKVMIHVQKPNANNQTPF